MNYGGEKLIGEVGKDADKNRGEGYISSNEDGDCSIFGTCPEMES